MKRIILLYLGALLLCLIAGVIVSLGFHYSWLYYLLSLFLLPIAWILMSDLFLRINEENLRKVSVFTGISFFVMIGLLVIAAYCRIDERSFWGMVYAATISSYVIGLTIVGVGLSRIWEERREKIEKREKKKRKYFQRERNIISTKVKIDIILMPIFFILSVNLFN